MSYIYLATSVQNGEPIAAYTRKYELRNWCRWEEKNGFPTGGWMGLYRMRGCLPVSELEYENGELIDKAT